MNDVTLSRILINYFSDVKLAKESGDYKQAKVMLDILSSYQLAKADQKSPPCVGPPHSKRHQDRGVGSVVSGEKALSYPDDHQRGCHQIGHQSQAGFMWLGYAVPVSPSGVHTTVVSTGG